MVLNDFECKLLSLTVILTYYILLMEQEHFVPSPWQGLIMEICFLDLGSRECLDWMALSWPVSSVG